MWLCVCLFLSAMVTLSWGHIREMDPRWRDSCPQIYLSEFKSYAPIGNETSGVFAKKATIHTIEDCIADCCDDKMCNIIFMHNTECFQISCYTNEACIPLYRPEAIFTTMVLVSPLPPADSWEEVVSVPQEEDDNYPVSDIMDVAESNYIYTSGHHTCEDGVLIDCPLHESCVTVAKHSRNGLCHCDQGYSRNASGVCVLMDKWKKDPETRMFVGKKLPFTESSSEPNKMFSEGELGGKTDVAIVEVSSVRPLKQLVVSAISKEVRLPENAVTLSAYTVPAEQPGEHYNYEWTLVSQPEGGNSGTMNDQNGGTLKLSNLIEGLYTFKVSVSSPGAYGETLANVTVLPPKRINQIPVAIISPSSQTVKLPNTGAVLDGSTSRDDDSIIGWHWELQQGPLGYQPHLVDTPTLQLDNLVMPGNYTFKLTVEDSDHATNFTTANITVLKVTDYPPEANAGQDIIVYLPKNNLTLNGNLSTDDRLIASWEWTKSPSDQNKAVDMQNTRTPYLQLSNLEKGIYTFVLKVTDSSGQSSSAEVHVFVKPPTNTPPVADAGQDLAVALPQTSVLLNGSHSSDDNKIVAWLWQQNSGPSKVSFSAINSSQTNVTDLTKGDYEFQLTVTDDSGNKASDVVRVTVTQNKNARPKANGGGDQTVVLPVSVVVLNGSQSSDDLGIVHWQWTREGSSLALGKVVGETDTSPVLMLTDVVPGRYVFRLHVSDDQGLGDEDTVSIIVKPDPHLLHLVELTLNIEGSMLTQSQQESLEAKLALLLRDEAAIHIQETRVEERTRHAVIVFYVDQKGGKTVLSGPAVVKRLKEKLKQDSGLLELSVANIQTAVCQNNCSGHGVCDQASRQCLCEAFWMQDLISKYLRDGDSNCDWSILYVIILLFIGVLLIVGGVWGMVCVFQRSCVRRPRKRQKYALLDEEEDVAMIPPLTHKIVLSETDSDSDVLFESRKCKANGDAHNGHKLRNGFAKIGRRIKT